jgi:DNA-binding Xre family transcriptional regulator
MCYNDSMKFSTAPVKTLAHKMGIHNPHALAREAGISYPTARRYWHNEGVGQLDPNVLWLLSRRLNCKPGELFEIVEDNKDVTEV